MNAFKCCVHLALFESLVEFCLCLLHAQTNLLSYKIIFLHLLAKLITNQSMALRTLNSKCYGYMFFLVKLIEENLL